MGAASLMNWFALFLGPAGACIRRATSGAAGPYLANPRDFGKFAGDNGRQRRQKRRQKRSQKRSLRMTISVVVPVKDEVDNVATLAREIAAALSHEPAYEIIFVDDGSSDGTAQKLTALKSEIAHFRPLRHDRNLGQSRGIHTGIEAAKGDIIVTLDGDGQNDPADIPMLAGQAARRPVPGHGLGRAGQAPGHRQPPHRLPAGQRLPQRHAGRRRHRHRLRHQGFLSRRLSSRFPISITCTAI